MDRFSINLQNELMQWRDLLYKIDDLIEYIQSLA